MIVVYIFLVLLGLSLGSFVNALVWRLHKDDKDLSIWKGRSVCPHCRHQLAAKDLIPVISWLSLKGKCRYCHKPISKQYPVVELVTTILVLASYIFWPGGDFTQAEIIKFGFWIPTLTGFMALVVYDLRWMLLPNKIIYSLIGLQAAQWLTGLITDTGLGYSWLDIALSGLIGGGLFYALFQLSKGKWIGGGDVKLGFLLGLVVGRPELTWLLLFLASLIGTLVTLPLMLSGKATRQSRIPFGPFLLVAGYIVVLFGDDIVSWLQLA